MKKLVSKKVVKSVIIMLLIAGAGLGGYSAYKNIVVAANGKNSAKDMTVKVARGDLRVIVSGTGAVEPVSKYDIVPLVKGNIINAPFEEGMKVKKGDLLYKIDDSNISYDIQKTQNEIEILKRDMQESIDSINSLEVYSPIDGRVTGLSINEGSHVGSNSKIASIVDDRYVIATIPFHKPQIEKIEVGQKAQIFIEDFMWYIDGEVRYVSNAARPIAGEAPVYDVEILVKNPGSLDEGMEVQGIIKALSGDIISPSKGTTSFLEEAVFTRVSGIVKKIYIKNNQGVKANQKILEIENDSLNLTYQKNLLKLGDLQLSLESQMDQLNEYNITSPIDGTVIKKYYKEGDTVNNASNNVTLMTIADLSKMVFTMDVDELDIAKISVGQKVTVTADALPGTVFNGEVTNVSLEGNSQNGVTTYPVQVTILDPGQLRPGMNVNAEIVVESKKSVLYLPISAITKVRDKAFVYVETDEGRQRREVTLGINNSDYIEIVSGLKEDEAVYLPFASSNNNRNNSAGSGLMGGNIRVPGGGRIRR